MRNAMLAILALGLGATTTTAQTLNWGDKLFKGVTSHDFGNVPRGAQLYHRFQITNIYAVPLEISNIRASCGCVTAKPSTQVLEPRQTAFLDVTMDAHRFTGPKTVTIYVSVGPQYTSTATLRVSANSRADVVFNPGQINFGIVPRGQSPTLTIDVEYAGALDWRVSEVVQNAAPLDVTLEELYRRPGQVGYRLRATLRKDAPRGLLKQELLLKTNDPSSPLVPVLVEATVQAPLEAVPGVVSFGTIKLGELLTRRVFVRGSKPFKITAIEGLGDDLKTELPAATAPVHILTLKYQAHHPGDFQQQLRIKTDLDAEVPVTVTVEGTVIP